MVDVSICNKCEKGKFRVVLSLKPNLFQTEAFTLKRSEREYGCGFVIDKIVKNGYFTEWSTVSFINNSDTKIIDVINCADGKIDITNPESCPYYLEHMVLTQKENEL